MSTGKKVAVGVATVTVSAAVVYVAATYWMDVLRNSRDEEEQPVG